MSEPTSSDAGPERVSLKSIGPFSASCRIVFAIADDVRARSGDNRLEMAHLFFALYEMLRSPKYAEEIRRDIAPERLLGILGLPRELKTEAWGGIKQATDVAPLSPHVTLAVKEARALRERAGDSVIKASQLLAGVLSVTESPIIQKLAKEPRSSTDPESRSAVDAGAENQVAFGQKVDVSVSVGDRVLLKKVGTTSIYIQKTSKPWVIPADAFVLPADDEMHVGGELGTALQTL